MKGARRLCQLCTTGNRPARPGPCVPASQLIESGRPHSSGLPPRPPTSSSRPPTSLSASAAFFGATASSASRPGTASPTGGPAGFLAAGASRPTTASSGGSSAATRYTEAGAVVAAVGGQLSVASIDAVQELLRGALADERAALMEDIEYLQVGGWGGGRGRGNGRGPWCRTLEVWGAVTVGSFSATRAWRAWAWESGYGSFVT